MVDSRHYEMMTADLLCSDIVDEIYRIQNVAKDMDGSNEHVDNIEREAWIRWQYAMKQIKKIRKYLSTIVRSAARSGRWLYIAMRIRQEFAVTAVNGAIRITQQHLPAPDFAYGFQDILAYASYVLEKLDVLKGVLDELREPEPAS